ncbi:zinc finger protein 513-like isoform X2 [Corythoichthys intestinalis]|nr:zinc finger protein 513-like isoform X2 [Corythoichthys intestinalis]XP_061803486.1 zinc finger protein 513-like [Nerophis lumbriciformis]
MPRRKQSNPQPVKLELENGGASCNPGCLVIDGDVLINGDMQFSNSEIMGLDEDSGVTVFSLCVDEDPSELTDTVFPPFLSCKACGQLLCDSPLGGSFQLGMGQDLQTEVSCVTCEGGAQGATSLKLTHNSKMADGKKRNKRRSVANADLSQKVYSCSLCAFTSRYSNHLKRHMNIHDGQKPYRCPLCPYASTQLVNLQRHARTHTGEKPYRCHQCHYACSSLGNLRRHQRLHTLDRTPRRSKDIRRTSRRKVKSETTASDLTLQVSQKSAYLNDASRPLPVLLFPLCCRLCGLTLEEADLDDINMEDRKESNRQVCHRCSLDPLVKDGANSLRNGLGPLESRQPGSRPYRCPLCPFMSHYPNHLARHAHIHSVEKPHRCPQCTYSSSHLDNLKRHLRVHTGEKPYQCLSCSYACGNLANLRRHERIHSGAKPFHCDICSYSCNQSMNLKRHMLRHTGEKPYACAECEYTTGHLDNYKRHQRKH